MAACGRWVLLLLPLLLASGLRAAEAAQHVMTLLPERRIPAEGGEAAVGDERSSQLSVLPDLPRLVATETARLWSGDPCGSHSRSYLAALNNFTLWATQMYDSSVKMPSGVLFGQRFQMGHFDECVSVRVGQLSGQYCMPELKVKPLEPQPLPEDPYSYNFDPFNSTWLKIQDAGDERKILRDKVRWALCVPSSCTTEQVRQSVAAAADRIAPSLGVSVIVSLEDDYCSVAEELYPDKPWDIVYLCILFFLVLMTTVATAYKAFCGDDSSMDTKKEKQGTGELLLLGFSLQNNLHYLSHKPNLVKALDDFNFLRFFFMLAIIAGHRMLICCGHAVYSGERLDKLFSYLGSMFLPNGALFVDGYFTLGAFTFAYFLMKGLAKTTSILQLLAAPVNRYVRLVPSYAVVLMFHISILPYIGNGPFWKPHVVREQIRCMKHWWTNLLFINNYLNVDDMCMFQSWYLSVDYHLFVLGLFLVYVIHRRPKIGWSIMIIVTFLSALAPFIEIYMQRLEPVIKPYPRILSDPRMEKTFQTVYVQTHSRGAPYMIGILTGVLLYKARLSTFKISKVLSYQLFIFSIVTGMAVIFSGYVFFIPTNPYKPLDAALYGTLSRISMSIIVCFLIILLMFGDMESLHKFFSLRIFMILGRLSYGAYLIHTIPQLYDQGSLRVPRNVDTFTTLWLLIGDWCVVYASSAILYLLVEAPFRTITKAIFSQGS